MMGEDLAQMAEKIPDLPAGLAEPESPPSTIWIAVRPDHFGLPPLAVAGIFLADALLLFLLLTALRRLWLLTRPRPVAPALPPARNEALRVLAQLRGSLSTATVRDIALQLSSVVRRFAEREYGIGLTTQTQEEFQALLAHYPDALPDRFAGELFAFLDACDQAKFKPGADLEELKNQLWEHAHRLIEQAPRAVRVETESA